ncbi:MAG: hypothetical protein R2795_25510 [Saprospiraceae bacterium]
MSKASLGELMTIRDILMGEIIEEYNERFVALEKQLKQQEADMLAKEAALLERITALEQLLHQKNEELSTHFTKKMTDDRQALGAMLLSVGQQLKG